LLPSSLVEPAPLGHSMIERTRRSASHVGEACEVNRTRTREQARPEIFLNRNASITARQQRAALCPLP